MGSKNIKKAYFAGGCFWGMEYYFQDVEGVISTNVGFMGGEAENPTYKEVSKGDTGHIETLEVVFDETKTNFETVAKLFFEIHDPTQINRQGPDIGERYSSVIFYSDNGQKEISERLISILRGKSYKVVTKVIKAEVFWKAEKYHQKYYTKKGGTPYCHVKRKIF